MAWTLFFSECNQHSQGFFSVSVKLFNTLTFYFTCACMGNVFKYILIVLYIVVIFIEETCTALSQPYHSFSCHVFIEQCCNYSMANFGCPNSPGFTDTVIHLAISFLAKNKTSCRAVM